MEPGVLTLAVIGSAGLVGYLGLFVALHLVPTGYSPVRHAVSDYAVGNARSLFRTGLLLSSLAVLLLAIGLTWQPGAPPLATSNLVFLYLVPVMRVGMVLFPTDLEGESLTRTGRLHYLFAIAAFGFTYAAVSGMTPDLTQLSPWQSVHGLLDVLRWVCLISLVLLVVTLLPRWRTVFGLFERIFLVGTNLWLLTVGVCLAVKAT